MEIIRFFLIENYPCNSRDELHSREGQIIRQYTSELECVNSYIAGRSKIEYRLDHKDKKQKTNKQYRLDHKDKIQETNKQYRLDNKEAIKEYYEKNKDNIQEYMKEYMKNYNEKNKEKAKETSTCVCGSCYRKTHKNRHEKTHKHQSYLKSIE